MKATIRRIAVSTTATIALLGGAAATATAAPEHEATVLAIAKTDAEPGRDFAPNGGVGAPLQNPGTNQMPAGYNEQIQTQASGGAIGVGVVAIVVFGLIVFFRVKGGHLKVGDAVVVTFLGVALAGTAIGGMADQITGSGVGALSNVLGGLSR
ncbi:hypothetical protein GCM10010293_40440 [Streptomyces griseoflavus]|uniref:hypothetical protein n=1 Tax=Streptomyces griseoflavus TaxID=35619 RepID=UPI00167C88EC|nr:hypothetical protein [Streptomyces griseoflavus]GGV36892.1 hypothetical protein GCM10010293_40440 [Streptomyces griseoflavus]